MFCSNCGNKLPDNAQICGICGKDILHDDSAAQNVKQPVPSEAGSSGNYGVKIRRSAMSVPFKLAIVLFCITTVVELVFLWSLCFTQLSSASSLFSYNAATEYANNYSSSFDYLTDGVFDLFYSVASGKIWNDYQLWFYIGAIAMTGIKLLIGYNFFYNGFKKREFEGPNYIALAFMKLIVLIGFYCGFSSAIGNSDYGQYITTYGLLTLLIALGITSIICSIVYTVAANREKMLDITNKRILNVR